MGTPVYRHNKGKIGPKLTKEELAKKTTFNLSTEGRMEKGFYNGDRNREIPMRELAIFSEVMALKCNKLQPEDVQFQNAKGFAEIDGVLREFKFTSLAEVEEAMDILLKELSAALPAGVSKDELEQKLLFIINTREWNDTPSDKEILEVLKELRSRQRAVINGKWDIADAENTKRKVSPQQIACEKKMEDLEGDLCGRILGGDVVIADRILLEKALKEAGITEAVEVGIAFVENPQDVDGFTPHQKIWTEYSAKNEEIT